MFVYTRMVAELGVVALAVHHVCMNLCDLFYSFAIGLSQASASYTGQNLGKKRPDLAVVYGKAGARLCMVVACFSFLLYVLGRDFLIGIYTNDEAVLHLGGSIIILMALSCFPSALQMIYAGVLRGAGDNFFVMLYSLGIIAVFRPILTFFLCFWLDLGLYGAWWALLCDQLLRMLCSGWRFYKEKWQYIRL